MEQNMAAEEKYRLVDSWMMDDKSRRILRERHLFNQDRDICHIRNIVEKETDDERIKHLFSFEKRQQLADECGKFKGDKPVYIWGCGIRGKELYKILKEKGFIIDAFLDAGYENKSQRDGIPVLKPTAEQCEDAVIIVAVKYSEDIYKQLESWNPFRVYDWVDYVYPKWSLGQYFDRDIVKLEKDEYFVDAGAFDLQTSLIFADFCKENQSVCHIYAFEPDPDNYRRCEAFASNNADLDINLYNEGLYDNDTELMFTGAGGSGSYIDENGDSSINVTRLDDTGIKKVTFIKMDLEGSEMPALLGAQETIRVQRPKLAICIYHKPEDIYDIPMYIKELNPAYQLYIRHYSNWDNETVLYAV